jgi:anti-sigma factor RsiW
MTSPYACARCRERLPWYAAGTLPLSERAEVEEHLAGCAACRREVALWRAVGSALGEIGAMGEMAPEPVSAREEREDVTWRGVQSRITADGRASGAGLRERYLMDNEIAPVTVGVTATQSRRGSARLAARQPFVALIAAALLIALSATLFGVNGARTRVGSPSTTNGPCAYGQTRAHLPPHTILADVSMVSATDGWATGEIWDAGASGAPPQGLMLRFQDCTWSVAGRSIPSAMLINVAMTSARDGWALGSTEKPAGADSWGTDQALLLHYTGETWRRVDLNTSHGFQGGALRMVSKDDGWLLLAYGSSPQSVLLYHYQGSFWTPVALPSQLQSAGIGAMFANAPNDIWIAGGSDLDSGSSVVAHYSNNQWQVWGSSIFGAAAPTLSAIRALSPHDVWAFNTHIRDLGPHGYNDEPYIMRYNGARWTRVPLAGLGDPAPNVTLWTATIARPDGSVLALGEEETPGDANTSPSNPRALIAVCAASGCQAQPFPIQGILMVSSISLYAPTQGYAIGCDAADQLQFCHGVLLSYDAGAWARIKS